MLAQALVLGLVDRRRARFAEIVEMAAVGFPRSALVRQNLGIGVIDGFTLAEQNSFGLRVIPIEEDTTFRTYVAFRNDTTLSSVAEFFIAALRARMKRAREAIAAHRGARVLRAGD